MKGKRMKISKSMWLIIVAVVLVIGGGAYYFVSVNNDNTASSAEQAQVEQSAPVSTITFNDNGTIVTYDGVAGETALATLKSLTDVQVEDSAYGEFVISIGVVSADSSKNFWGFYVNGDMASVGAGDYVAKEGDQIEWQLTELK